MLKGTRDAIVKRIQPISIHGQMSWDLAFVYSDDDEEQLRGARVGPEAVSRDVAVGDRVRLEYLLGVVVRVTRV